MSKLIVLEGLDGAWVELSNTVSYLKQLKIDNE